MKSYIDAPNYYRVTNDTLFLYMTFSSAIHSVNTKRLRAAIASTVAMM